MENRPWKPPFANRGLLASNTKLFPPARAESEPYRLTYTASVWRQPGHQSSVYFPYAWFDPTRYSVAVTMVCIRKLIDTPC